MNQKLIERKQNNKENMQEKTPRKEAKKERKFRRKKVPPSKSLKQRIQIQQEKLESN